MNIQKYVYSSIFLVLLSFPLYAHAGVFSFFSGFFSPTHVSAAETSSPNSQNMALLVASLSPNPGATTSKKDTVILDGMSLSPESQAIAPDFSIRSSNNDQISLYIVHKGDTLPAIAQMFGVSVNTIIWANNIKGSKVSAGDKLVILPISGVQYKVVKGDTLASIAKKYKGDVDEIAQFNNLSVDTALAVGEIVIIPDGEVSASESGPVVKASSGGTVHVNPGGTSPLASGALPAPTGSPTVGSQCSAYPSIVGYYMRPVANCIKTQGIHGHNGVDLASIGGEHVPVMASADGEVIVAHEGGWNGGYGSYIVIKHDNGTQTLYAHLSSVGVSVGDGVSQGDVIGRMGNSGDSTGTHLHFEVRGASNPF